MSQHLLFLSTLCDYCGRNVCFFLGEDEISTCARLFLLPPLKPLFGVVFCVVGEGKSGNVRRTKEIATFQPPLGALCWRIQAA